MAGIPDPVAEGVRRWATANPIIERVWLFGSRARGTHRLDSDIDLAVAIAGWDSDEESQQAALGEWIFRDEAWQRQLQSLTVLAVHLNPVSLEDERVLPAVREHGRLLYER